MQAVGKLGRPPQQASDLHEALKNGPGNPDPETILRSPDDNENYVIVWGVDFGQLAKSGVSVNNVILAYEQKGLRGKRHVLKPPSQVLVLGNEEFKASVFPPGHTPAP